VSRDFAGLAARLLQSAEALLPAWFPAGRWRGHEYVVGNLRGDAGDSLSINSRTGQWKDFAAGDDSKGGDLLALYAAAQSLSQSQAYDELNEGGAWVPERAPDAPPLEPAKPRRRDWTPILPVPEGVRAPTDRYHRNVEEDRAKPARWQAHDAVARWTYRDADGRVLGYTCRFEWDETDTATGEIKRVKDIVPQTYCENHEGKRDWRWRSFMPARPLYNLDGLAARPNAPVMLVEGEKKVEALRELAPQYVGVAWPGGANARDKTDWSPLKGRTVTCWPDNDDVGIAAMYEIANKHLLRRCPVVKIIIPEGQPPKWDAADALAEGWDWERLKAWAVPRVQLIQEQSNGSTDTGQGKRRAGRREQNSEADDREGADAQPHTGGGELRAGVRCDGRDENEVAIRSGAGDASAGERDAEIEALGSDGDPRMGADVVQAEAGDRGGALGGTALVASSDQQQGSGVECVARDAHRAGAADQRPAPRLGIARDERELDADADRERERSRANGARAGEAARGVSRAETGLPDSDELHARADPVPTGITLEAEAGGSQVAKWLAWGLDRNGNGLPLANLNNAVRVLECDPRLRGYVWFDDFLQRLRTGDQPRDWIDADDVNLTLYMQRVIGISKIGRDIVSQAVIAVAYRRTRDSLREFVEALPAWDGIERCAKFFSDVFGARESTYAQFVGLNFWKALLVRALKPGTKVDNMVVLEGGQGSGKSSALRAIVGDEWFAEASEEVTAKDFFVGLQGKWLIEIAELDSFGRSEVTSIKRVITCQSDRFRSPYGRNAVDHPRRCILAGTANHDDWNRDETGARRFWPIRCARDAQVRVDIIHAMRLQYMAEARARIAQGETWWQMPDEETLAEQRKRYDADPWLDPVSGYLIGRDEITTNELLLECLKFETNRISKGDQMRVTRCLTVLGWWNEGQVKRSGRVLRVWRHPDIGRLDLGENHS
jgi:predicted P-loop ATPase